MVFDLYGTLIDISTDETQPKMWAALAKSLNRKGWTGPKLRGAYLKATAEKLRDREALAKTDHVDIDLLEVFIQILGCSVQEAQEFARTFRRLTTKHLRPYPYALEVLLMLRGRGVRTLLLSNAQACFTKGELVDTGLMAYFDGIYLSSDVGFVKPSSEFFNHMLSKENLRPEDCLFVGNDHIADLFGANTVGIPCVYMHTNCSQNQLPQVLEAQWFIGEPRLDQVFNALTAVLKRGDL